MKNVLIILTDQQRRDSLGCYGNGYTRTPNIDGLAERGVRFERNYVANPICMPNRLSLFTGRTIRNHGLWTNGLLLPERTTLAHAFRNSGYQTASFGKIHFTPYGGKGEHKECMARWRSGDEDVGWCGPYWGGEHVELTLGHTAPFAHYGAWFYGQGGTDDMLAVQAVAGAAQSGVRELPEELHDSAFVADRTVDFLRRRRACPFFLVASFPDPHHPFNPPRTATERYASGEVKMPVGGPEDLDSRPAHYARHFRGGWHRKGHCPETHPNGLSVEHTRERIAHTSAMVELIDRNVGRILEALEQENLADETIVAFTSDHGELLGDHGLWFKGPFFYEGLINTPLILSSPGQVTPGVSEALFSDIDLAPTLCDLAGVTPPPYMDGRSQVPHLRDPHITVRDQCLVEYRNGYGENDCSSKVIVTDRYKYVRYQIGQEELTDLIEDPLERKNVAGISCYASIKRDLQAMLLDEILSTESRGPEQIGHA